jgi:hypothetical protein
VTTAVGGDELPLDRRMARLAAERGELFGKAGNNFGLSGNDQQRLRAVERELDECFDVRRRQRAANNVRRFDRESPVRGGLPMRAARR